MSRCVFWLVAALWVAATIGTTPHVRALGLQQLPASVPGTASQQRATLDRYCVTCHNSRFTA